eukprot:scaffold344_cov189-Alexandrium_tamarense.AAC.21
MWGQLSRQLYCGHFGCLTFARLTAAFRQYCFRMVARCCWWCPSRLATHWFTRWHHTIVSVQLSISGAISGVVLAESWKDISSDQPPVQSPVWMSSSRTCTKRTGYRLSEDT